MDNSRTIVPARYSELARLVWNRDPTRPLTGVEALSLYERNWRHVDVSSLSEEERELIRSLTQQFGNGHLLTTK